MEPEQLFEDTVRAIADLDKQLENVQRELTKRRLTQAMALEGNKKISFDAAVKARISDEAMANAFARVIESRTHLDMAKRGLELVRKGA